MGKKRKYKDPNTNVHFFARPPQLDASGGTMELWWERWEREIGVKVPEVFRDHIPVRGGGFAKRTKKRFFRRR